MPAAIPTTFFALSLFKLAFTFEGGNTVSWFNMEMDPGVQDFKIVDQGKIILFQ